MRVGLMIPPGHTDRASVESIARTAESAGFDQLACGEHVFFHDECVNSLVLLTAAAALTERIRLLSAVTLLPLYPAPLAAKMAATLACFSGDRLDLGIGVGGENPAEFLACGVAPERRGAIMNEAVPIVRDLLDGRPLPGSDPPLRLQPAPARRVPLWIGGRKGASIRRAGRYADVWLPHLCTPDQLGRSLAEVRAEADRAGRDPGRVRGAVLLWGAVDQDADWARQSTIAALHRIYRQDFTNLVDRYCVFGTPEQVTNGLSQYAAAGADSVVFAPACSADELPRVLDSFIDKVLPALRPATPTADAEQERNYAQ